MNLFGFMARSGAKVMQSVVPSGARRSYDGGGWVNALAGWVTGFRADANADLKASFVQLRARCRDLERNQPYFRNAVNIIVNFSVGDGIRPVARSESKRINDAMLAYWHDFCEKSGFYHQQKIAARSIVTSGEVVARISVGQGDLPVLVRLFEGDFVDDTKTDYGTSGASRAVMGVEMDGMGDIKGYWIYDQHPGDVRGGGVVSRLDSSGELRLIFEQARPGQVRGVPKGAAAILRSRMLDDYELSEVERKRFQASIPAIVENLTSGGDIDQGSIGASTLTDADGKLVDVLKQGQVAYLNGPGQIKFPQVPDSPGFADFRRAQVQAIATAFGLTYEMISGDISQANFSSSRFGWDMAHRHMKAFQQDVLVRQFVHPVWRMVMEQGILRGALPPAARPLIDKVTYHGPQKPSPDPAKDNQADMLAIRCGYKSLSQVVAERGGDSDAVLRDLAADLKYAEELGLVLDIDGRRATAQGHEKTVVLSGDEIQK